MKHSLLLCRAAVFLVLMSSAAYAQQDGYALAQQKVQLINRDVKTMADYGDHLIGGMTSPGEQGFCLQALNELQTFVAQANVAYQQNSNDDTAKGNKTLADGIQRSLAQGDEMPCPSAQDYSQYGKKAFNPR